MENVFVAGLFTDRVLTAYDGTVTKELDSTTFRVTNFDRIKKFDFVQEIITAFDEENKEKDLCFDDLHLDEQVDIIIEQTRDSEQGIVKYLATNELASQYAELKRLDQKLIQLRKYTIDDYVFTGGKCIDRIYKFRENDEGRYVLDSRTIRDYTICEMVEMFEDEIEDVLKTKNVKLKHYNTDIVEMLIENVNEDVSYDLEITDLRPYYLINVIKEVLNTEYNKDKYVFRSFFRWCKDKKQHTSFLENHYSHDTTWYERYEYKGMVEDKYDKDLMVELWVRNKDL